MIKELSLWNRFGALAICGAVALAGCGGGGGEEAPAESGDAPAEQAAAPAEQAATGASAGDSGSVAAVQGVTGKVTFEGTPPERNVIEAEGDAFCAEHHAEEPLLSENVIVGPDGGLANVFIYVDNAPDGAEVPSTPAVLDQVGCRYTPHVMGVMAGQEIEIRNSDQTTHNVRAITRKQRGINIAQPVGSPPRTKTFKVVEYPVRMKCDLHPWMTGFVFVMDHPYFAVSDEAGNFVLTGLPAGEYEIVAWHETYDEQEGTVTVAEDGTGTINFTFSE